MLTDGSSWSRNTGEQPRQESNEEVLGDMIDNITKLERDVSQAYEPFHSASGAPPQGIVCKVDTCVAISKDLISAINEKISGFEDSAFNLRNNKYARSIISDLTLSGVSESNSVRSQLSAKYIDAVADLASKKVEFEYIKREEENQMKFQALQEQQRPLLESQQHGVRKLQVEKSVAITEAKLQAYSDLLQREENFAGATNNHATILPVVTPMSQPTVGLVITPTIKPYIESVARL